MDLGHPERVISNPLDGTVLVVLVGTTRPLTGREVARLARDGTQQGVAKALRRLARLGVVDAQQAGRSVLYVLNWDHLAAPAIEVLARLRAELVDRLRNIIGAWAVRPEHASMFGSAARGDGGPESDVDIFIVRPTGTEEEDPSWREQLDELATRVLVLTGNHAGIAEVGSAEVKRLRQQRPAVVRELERDSIQLAGKKLSKILARAS